MRKTITLILSIIFLIGCGTSNQIDGQLVVGMECNYAPFNWTQNFESESSIALSEQNTYCDGYDVAVAKIIAHDLNKELVIKNYAVFTGLLEGAKAGDIDLIIAGMTDTEERRQEVSFSQVYYKSEMVLVVRKDGNYKDATSIRDFENATVSAQIGTMHDELIDQITNVDHSMPLDSFPSLTTALTSKAIDAFVSEKPVAMAITASNKDLMFVEFTENNGFIVDEEEVTVSIGVAKENTELLADVNESLARLDDEARDELMLSAINRQPGNKQLMPDGFFAGVLFLLQNNADLFLRGVLSTILIALVGTGFGLLIGLLIAILRNNKIHKHDHALTKTLKYVFHKVTDLYVLILRGTPMMVQSILFYYGLHSSGIPISPLLSAFIIISVNTSAYMAEILRSSIQAIDKGQYEAALSIGMNDTQTMINIVLPQAIRNAIPAIGNEFVVNIKDSSVLNVITVSELFFQANRLNGIYYRQIEPFAIVAVLYLLMTLVSTKILNYVEYKLDHPKGTYPQSLTTVHNFETVQGDE